MAALLLGGVVILAAITFFYHFYWKRRNLPPGPLPLPLVGNIIELLRNSPGYTAHTNWRQRYGPVYTFWIGPLPLVAVGEYNALVDTFVKEADTFAGRLQITWSLEWLRKGPYGLLESEGPLWREQRRFALHTLRDLGVGRNLMEERVLEEATSMCRKIEESLEANNGEKNHVNMGEYLNVAVGSIINNVLFGYRFDDEHLEEFRDLKAMLDVYVRQLASPLLAMFIQMPVLRHFPPWSGAFRKTTENRDRLWAFFNKNIDKHKAVFDPTAEPDDYVQAFLKERHERTKNGEDGGTFIDIQLLNVVTDLWIAGMETTITTLLWGVLYMIYDQDVQQKVHDEIDRNINEDREIRMDDKARLPYTCAVISEMQRRANILAMNVPHRVTKDTTINGYFIPQGTICVPQISVVHLDPSVFPDPQRFDPTRFLHEDGTAKKVDQLLPFSIGKRQCPGESLARMELFLLFANLMRKFRVTANAGEKLPSLEGRMGATTQPWPYTCRVQLRQSLN